MVRTAPLQESIGYALRRAQGAVYSTLNDALGIQKANCVPTMSELERRGLIIRRKSTSDARLYELHITNKGRRILQRAGEVQSSHEQRLIDRIGPEGREQLLRLLGKLTDFK